MKFALVALAALMTASPALAQSQTTGSHADHHPAADAAATTVEGSGQIKAVDAKVGTITIHHAPIAALGWPAMTMTFKAAPDVLQTAKAGQMVKFKLTAADNSVVAIEPQ